MNDEIFLINLRNFAQSYKSSKNEVKKLNHVQEMWGTSTKIRSRCESFRNFWLLKDSNVKYRTAGTWSGQEEKAIEKIERQNIPANCRKLFLSAATKNVQNQTFFNRFQILSGENPQSHFKVHQRGKWELCAVQLR